ncbi:hypothetical protein FOZ62_031441, partial [Perkinsus olseni]
VLFATETFAMGVNMPARSVIFSSIRKHDGSKFRYLLPTEYTQMSGRAGRRGLDSVGNVYVLAADELPDLKALTTTMTSKHTPLQSQFKLTFQMLLQMAKLTHWKAEDLMSRSYLENARAMQLPTARRDLLRLKKRQSDLPKLECVLGEEDMHRYAKLELKSRDMASDLYGTLFNTDHKKVFCRGRLVMVWSLPDIKASSPAVILGSSPPSMSTSVVATVDVLVVLRKPVPGSSPAGDSGYTVRIKNLPVKSGLLLVTNHALPNGVDFSDAFGLAREMRRCEDAGQFDEPLELGKNLKQIQTEYFDTLIGVKDLTKAKMKSKCHRCHLRQEHFDLVVEEGQIEGDIEDLEFKIDDSSLYLAPARERMLRVLVDLGELDKDTMQITLKGRAASELVLGDELTLTELLFRNEFGEADVPSCVALVCCFACDSGVSQMSHEAAEALLPPETVKLLEQAMETHGKVAEILTKERVETDWTEFDKQLCLGIAPLAYAWAKGVPFAELMTAEPIQSKEDEEVYYSLWKPGDKPLQEGAVVRSIQRCDELFRRLGKAAGVMGSTEVVEKVEKCREAIRRDIVFALSLYLEQDGQRQASKAVDEAGEKEGSPVEELALMPSTPHGYVRQESDIDIEEASDDDDSDSTYEGPSADFVDPAMVQRDGCCQRLCRCLCPRRKVKETGFRLVRADDRRTNRPIVIDEDGEMKFLRKVSNVVASTKYTIMSFVPMVFAQQFKFFFNFFFLVLAVTQSLPPLRVGPMFTYIGPLVFVLMCTMLKEASDDIKR